jgi:phosphoribosylanthranilate isomerase
MIKLKVCGMRDPDNILQVASMYPDYMGFIFYPKSPRYVHKHFKIPEFFPLAIKRVGVFVDAAIEEMIEKVRTYKLDYLQLHGNESPELCEALKKSGVGVIKAFSVDSNFDFNITKPYKSFVDFFLFDTKGKFYGGNAEVFDWGVLQKYDQEVPFFLSGGLNAGNISGIASLLKMNIHALDVNSGIEIAPAVKNPALLKKIKKELKDLEGQ